MNPDQPSRTALEVAMFRAAHQLLDVPCVFEDPLALRIAGNQAEHTIRSNPRWAAATSGIRAFIAARSRRFEDACEQALRRGVRQIVILGAGLDTLAYRCRDFDAAVRVIEVDHLATQTWKRRRLTETGIEIPDSLTFASFDFEQQTLADGLRDVGFRLDKPAIVSLLGTVIFLQRVTVLTILKFVGSLPPGSEIVFDYGISADKLTNQQRADRNAAARQAAALGEPFVTFLDPTNLSDELKQFGFHEIDDLGFRELNEFYFQNRTDGLCVPGGGRRLICARV